MTSLKCNYCGFVMQNTDLCGIEFTLISKEVLNQHQHGDKAICELHKNVPNCYSTIWKCPVCNALHWFKGSESNVENVYIPVDLADLKKVAAPIKGDKYAIFVDYILDLLTDDELTP